MLNDIIGGQTAPTRESKSQASRNSEHAELPIRLASPIIQSCQVSQRSTVACAIVVLTAMGLVSTFFLWESQIFRLWDEAIWVSSESQFMLCIARGTSVLFVVLLPVTVVCGIAELLSRLKLGNSRLILASRHGVIGGKLAGVIKLDNSARTKYGFVVRLFCIESPNRTDTTTRCGLFANDRRSQLVWHDERFISTTSSYMDRTNTIPILFEIPANCPSSEKVNVKWHLQIESATTGFDYRAEFEVPIRHEAVHQEMDESVFADFRIAHDSIALAARQGSRIEPFGNGCRYQFPRDWEMCCYSTCRAAGVGLGLAYLQRVHAHWVYWVPLFTYLLFLLFQIAFNILVRRRVRADRDGVLLRGHHIPKPIIKTIRPEVTYRKNDPSPRFNLAVDLNGSGRAYFLIRSEILSLSAARAIAKDMLDRLQSNPSCP